MIENRSQSDEHCPIPDAIKALYGFHVDDSDHADPPASEGPKDDAQESSLFDSDFVVAIVACVCLILMVPFCNVVNRMLSDLSAIDLVNANHGMTFEEFCDNARDGAYEYWAAFDEDGKKIAECTIHDATCVTTPLKLYQYAIRRGATAIAHNHPSVDCPFSDADLISLVRNYYHDGITVSCVVSPNYLYRLEIVDGFDAEEIFGTYVDFLNTFFETYKDDPTYFTKTVLGDGTTGYVSTDSFIQVVADQFGFVFTKTPLSSAAEP